MSRIRSFGNGFKRGFKNFGLAANKNITTAVLLIVYFIGFGPISFIGKLLKKSFLEMKLEPNESYWQDIKISKEFEDYYKTY